MKKGVIIVIVIIILMIGIKMVTTKKDVNNNNSNDLKVSTETLEIENLNDLFPSDKKNIDYQNEGIKTKVNVIEVKTEDDKKIVKTKREEKQDKETYTIEMTYEITDDKVVESGKYLKDSKEVSKIYPQEIIKGSLSVGNEWKSVDGMITHKVISTTKDKVIIEASRQIDIYDESSKTLVKKTYVETRTFEKGNGLIAYKTETR